MLAEIPFVVLPFFVGPVAAAMSEVDIAFIVGLLVSGLVYIGVTRSLDVSHELELIHSHPELADPASVNESPKPLPKRRSDAMAATREALPGVDRCRGGPLLEGGLLKLWAYWLNMSKRPTPWW